jgi:hypothetical protein
MTGSLSIDVFNRCDKPVPDGPMWDGQTPATWPASTSTPISAHRDALLTGALLTADEGHRVAECVMRSNDPVHAVRLRLQPVPRPATSGNRAGQSLNRNRKGEPCRR